MEGLMYLFACHITWSTHGTECGFAQNHDSSAIQEDILNCHGRPYAPERREGFILQDDGPDVRPLRAHLVDKYWEKHHNR